MLSYKFWGRKFWGLTSSISILTVPKRRNWNWPGLYNKTPACRRIPIARPRTVTERDTNTRSDEYLSSLSAARQPRISQRKQIHRVAQRKRFGNKYVTVDRWQYFCFLFKKKIFVIYFSSTEYSDFVYFSGRISHDKQWRFAKKQLFYFDRTFIIALSRCVNAGIIGFGRLTPFQRYLWQD